MIKLNKKQTKAIERLFKKMDLLTIGFGEAENEDEVEVYITNWKGQNINIVLGENGIAQKLVNAEGLEL